MASSGRTFSFYQNLATGLWIAGYDKDMNYEWSDRMQDAMLFYGANPHVALRDYRVETVTLRPWHPPRPKQWKPAKPKKKAKTPAKSKSKKSEQEETPVADESAPAWTS